MAAEVIAEIALAIEMGADAVDIGKTIHLYPTLGESIGMAAAPACHRTRLSAIREMRHCGFTKSR